ncbi:DUF523 domain-containing protein [Chitinilyticum aquatile]|uniref:DUF523 domain-containing protein n=1 Tax=Chitinilyticum aquatile TaxID=362520 RepID=UPI0003FF68E8|nr:DUF523 domain-containing protein [Chitinilyticum aquatile]
MSKPALLMSACLCGQAVRYDATGKPLPAEWAARLSARFAIVPVCPEMAGGLPAPRAPCEIRGGDGYDVLAGRAEVMTAAGDNLSLPFCRGATRAADLAREHDCHVALLKANSPSCGSGTIYSGDFDGRHKNGDGVCAAALRRAGLAVFSELELEQLLQEAEQA